MPGFRFLRHGVLSLFCAVCLAPLPSFAASKIREPAAAPVRTAVIEQHDVPRLARTFGSVLAASTVQIKSQVEGRILSAAFTEGQLVKTGDLLFRIDPRPFQADLDQARAVLARDRAQWDQAQRELARQQDLRARGVASAQKLEQAQADAKALASTVAADEAAVNSAKLKLEYTEIRSPISGKTGAIQIHPGNTVKANGDTPLVTISQIEPVRISAALPQQMLPLIQTRMAEGGTDLQIDAPGNDQQTLHGTVDFVSPVVDASTGTVEIRASIANRDHRLVPGQFVTAAFTLEVLPQVLVVPTDALNAGQTGSYLYIVDDQSKARVHTVNVVYADSGLAAITSETLKVGDRAIIDGQLRLADGVPVRLASDLTPAAAAKAKP